MVDVILEPERCQHCGQPLPAPRDGRWRYAKSGKTFETAEQATEAAKAAGAKLDGWEFRAVVDERGRHRIASRRKR